MRDVLVPQEAVYHMNLFTIFQTWLKGWTVLPEANVKDSKSTAKKCDFIFALEEKDKSVLFSFVNNDSQRAKQIC